MLYLFKTWYQYDIKATKFAVSWSLCNHNSTRQVSKNNESKGFAPIEPIGTNTTLLD